jgi:hypothetical protein
MSRPIAMSAPGAASPPLSPVFIARRLVSRLRLERAATFMAFALFALATVVTGGSGGLPAIGGLLAATIAFLTFRLRQVDAAITELRRRQQEREGLANALLSEMLDNIRGAHRAYKFNGLAQIKEMMDGHSDYLPFMLPDPASARVYEAMLERLVLLPREVIVRVVSYHGADAALNAAIETLTNKDRGLERTPIRLDTRRSPEGLGVSLGVRLCRSPSSASKSSPAGSAGGATLPRRRSGWSRRRPGPA